MIKTPICRPAVSGPIPGQSLPIRRGHGPWRRPTYPGAPYSNEYLHNIKVVDQGVQAVTKLVEDFYGDDKTRSFRSNSGSVFADSKRSWTLEKTHVSRCVASTVKSSYSTRADTLGAGAVLIFCRCSRRAPCPVGSMRKCSGIQSQQVEEEHQFVVPQFPVQFRVSLCRFEEVMELGQS
jgi:hypothetical protein